MSGRKFLLTLTSVALKLTYTCTTKSTKKPWLNIKPILKKFSENFAHQMRNFFSESCLVAKSSFNFLIMEFMIVQYRN